MSIKVFIGTIFTAILLLTSVVPLLAATSSRGAIVQPKLRADKRAVVINFSKLDNVESVSYSLTYTFRGIAQGVGGRLIPAGQSSVSRELLLGTCSKNVCTYHTNIKNLRLVVRSKLKSGSPRYVLKSFRFKI